MTCSVLEWVTGGAHGCVMDGWLSQATELQFGLLLAIVIAVPLWIKYEDPVPPAIGLLLVSAVLWPILPAQVAGIAWVVLFFAIATMIFTIMYKTSL